MADEKYLYGVYDCGDELYPARWYVNGLFFPQDADKPEYHTAIDLILND